MMRSRVIAVLLLIGCTLGAVPGYEGWRLSRFSRIEVGMAKIEVTKLLGPPTSRGVGVCLPEQSCAAGTCWVYRQRLFEHLVVTFDSAGTVICRETYRPEIRQHG